MIASAIYFGLLETKLTRVSRRHRYFAFVRCHGVRAEGIEHVCREACRVTGSTVVLVRQDWHSKLPLPIPLPIKGRGVISGIDQSIIGQ